MGGHLESVQPTQSEPEPVPPQRKPGRAGRALVILRGWEFLRPLYIVVLVAWVLLFLPFMLDVVFDRSVLMLLLKGAIAANLAYFTGALAEIYLDFLGLRARWVRPLLFFLGTAFASVLTACVMISVSWNTFG